MHNDPNDVASVVFEVKRWLPDVLEEWPGGWPGKTEAASYGQSHNGDRGAIARWRTERGDEGLDDLESPSAYRWGVFGCVIGNHQPLSGGQLEAAGIVEAA